MIEEEKAHEESGFETTLPHKFTPSPLGVIRIKSPDGKVKLFQANRKDRRAFLRRNRKRLVKL